MKNFLINYAGTIGTTVLFLFVLMCFKATGVIEWSYWWVLSPVLIGVLVVASFEIVKKK